MLPPNLQTIIIGQMLSIVVQGKREDGQNCFVLYCSLQLCKMICKDTYWAVSYRRLGVRHQWRLLKYLTSVQSNLQKPASPTGHPLQPWTDSSDLEPHRIHGPLDRHESARQTASGWVQPLVHSTSVWPTYRQKWKNNWPISVLNSLSVQLIINFFDISFFFSQFIIFFNDCLRDLTSSQYLLTCTVQTSTKTHHTQESSYILTVFSFDETS